MALENCRCAIKALMRELKLCKRKDKIEKAKLLIISFYNKSIEENYLKYFSISKSSGENALVLAEEILGMEHPMTISIASSYYKRMNRFEKMQKKDKIFPMNYVECKPNKTPTDIYNLTVNSLRVILSYIPDDLLKAEPNVLKPDQNLLSLKSFGTAHLANKIFKEKNVVKIEGLSSDSSIELLGENDSFLKEKSLNEVKKFLTKSRVKKGQQRLQIKFKRKDSLKRNFTYHQTAASDSNNKNVENKKLNFNETVQEVNEELEAGSKNNIVTPSYGKQETATKIKMKKIEEERLNKKINIKTSLENFGPEITQGYQKFTKSKFSNKNDLNSFKIVFSESEKRKTRQKNAVIKIQSFIRMKILNSIYKEKIEKLLSKEKQFLFIKFMKLEIDPPIKNISKDYFKISCYLDLNNFNIQFTANSFSLNFLKGLKLSMILSEVKYLGNKVLSKKIKRAKNLANHFCSSLIIIDTKLEFEKDAKIDRIIDNLLNGDWEIAEEAIIDKNSTSLEFTKRLIPPKRKKSKRRSSTQFLTTLEPNYKPNKLSMLSASNLDSIEENKPSQKELKEMSRITKIETYEDYINTSALLIQKFVRGYLARIKFWGAKKTESIKVFEMEFNQQGETFFVIFMLRFLNRKITIYCWNLSAMERYTTVSISCKKLRKNRDYKKIWQRMYFSIEENLIFFEDFWKDAKDKNLSPDDRESLKASKFMHLYCKGKKFMKKIFRSKDDYKTIGKKTFQYKGSYFLMIGSIKAVNSSFRLQLFSKRINDFCHSKTFYNLGNPLNLIQFSQKVFSECKVAPIVSGSFVKMKLKFGPSDFSLDKYTQIHHFAAINIQRNFRKKRRIMMFDYIIKENRFKLKVYWLDQLNLLLIKFYASSKLEDKRLKFQTKNFEKKGLTFSEFTKGSRLTTESIEKSKGTIEMSEMSNIVTPKQNLFKKDVLFQILKIDLQDLYIDRRKLDFEKVNDIITFVILKKLTYTSYFFLTYFENEEIAELVVPEKHFQEKLLWKKYDDQALISDETKRVLNASSFCNHSRLEIRLIDHKKMFQRSNSSKTKINDYLNESGLRKSLFMRPADFAAKRSFLEELKENALTEKNNQSDMNNKSFFSIKEKKKSEKNSFNFKMDLSLPKDKIENVDEFFFEIDDQFDNISLPSEPEDILNLYNKDNSENIYKLKIIDNEHKILENNEIVSNSSVSKRTAAFFKSGFQGRKNSSQDDGRSRTSPTFKFTDLSNPNFINNNFSLEKSLTKTSNKKKPQVILARSISSSEKDGSEILSISSENNTIREMIVNFF